MAQVVKNLPALQDSWVQSLGGEDSLEKRMATHSIILPFWNGEFHGQRSLVGYSPWGHRVGRDWVTYTIAWGEQLPPSAREPAFHMCSWGVMQDLSSIYAWLGPLFRHRLLLPFRLSGCSHPWWPASQALSFSLSSRQSVLPLCDCAIGQNCIHQVLSSVVPCFQGLIPCLLLVSLQCLQSYFYYFN